MTSELDDIRRFKLLVDSVVDYAIFMLDPQGRVTTWNPGAQRIKGWRADEIIGRSFETFYSPEAVAAGWPQEELRRAERDGRFEDLGWRICKDGRRIWASVVITAVRDERGHLIGYGKVVRDLTDARVQQEALRHSEEQFRRLVQSVKDYAIFMLDAQGTIRTWNDGAMAIHGWEPTEVLGSHFSRLFTPEDAAGGRPADELARALHEGHAEDEGWRLRKGGARFWADVVVTPVRDARGALIGFAKVTRDLTEQRRLAELEHSSRRMSEFLAMLAHELRNPLAPIRNAVNVMDTMNALPATLVQLRDVIARQTGQLTRLVDDLLDVARVATGKIFLRRTAIDFREVVHESVEAVQPEMDARGHHLSLTLPGGPLPMRGDAARLAQVLQNLLNNAARYTPDGGEIGLSVTTGEGDCEVVVSDNGIGIAPHSLTRIFDLFVQEAPGAPALARGLGVGLALARMLVVQHGGSLQAASEGVGRGSRFTLTLPLSPAYVEATEPGRAGGTVRQREGAVERARVLVVDDNRDAADTLVSLIGALGHDASAAYSLPEAMAAADTLNPTVALLDLSMPDNDGFFILARLRERPGLERVYAAAVTGYGQASDRARTQAAGFDAHLTKPVDVGQLEALLVSARAAGAQR